MHVFVTCFWLPKAGSALAEYEDSYDFSYNRHGPGEREITPRFTAASREMKRPRFAVADGATESSFSGLWAQMLVDAYVDRDPRTPAALRRLVERCAECWTREISTKPLPWYAQDKARQGAFATLLGLCLREGGKRMPSGGLWTALAVGDSCLFQMRGVELVTCFPVERADELGYRPWLVSSIPERNLPVWEQSVLKQVGTWLPGDIFLLMTDALAHWFLSERESGGQPWRMLRDVTKQARSLSKGFEEWIFENWVGQMRAAGTMHNDDVTLLVVAVGENHGTAPVR
jgi:hypothetical protein